MAMLAQADRVKETSTTTGTGTLDLAGAPDALSQSFVAGVGDGNECLYAIVDETNGDWEVGRGTVTDATPDTLSRDTIFASSNSDAAVDFGAGTKTVFTTIPADVHPGAGCKLYRTTAQTIPDATGTNILWDAEEWDERDWHSTSTNTDRVTVDQDGIYEVKFSAQWEESGTGARYVIIQVNGTDSVGANRVVALSSGDTWNECNMTLALSASDYLVARVVQYSGGDLDFGGTAPTNSPFSGALTVRRVALPTA